ncbi:MAG: 50S ribosomal protein L31, partial [Gammaproteobacteria bacterium]|nr:50S ribosomal protein L31 [Gammaproteobacteria bacterium]
MKEGIHPEYAALEATCSCGNVIKTKSTKPGTMYLDVCSACHPFYTGKQKVVD